MSQEKAYDSQPMASLPTYETQGYAPAGQVQAPVFTGTHPAYVQSVPQPQGDAALGSQYQQQLMARCARGEHDVTKKYGVCGIICAICLFPLGLFCLLVDNKKVCTRCGTTVG